MSGQREDSTCKYPLLNYKQARAIGQALMELEVTQHVGAEQERAPTRTSQRNGYWERE